MMDSADPALQYSFLKELHLETPLVRAGQAVATLEIPDHGVYDHLAARIGQTIRTLTGVAVPVRTATAEVPLTGHVILVGNRSTHRTIEELYNRHFCLLDLRYPGRGGHVLRSLHNPFGNGHNAILAGGSDDAGVAAAVEALCERLEEAARPRPSDTEGDLSLGWLMDIALGEDLSLPDQLADYEIWEASAGYGSVGYFGWNSLSKRLAAYYMTGVEEEARQFLRLAFPDDEARAEIADLDGERVENKDEPLAGPYHYNAHMMILFWDLVEESPVFSDADRLRVTNAFARQFFHAEDRVYRRSLLENSQSGRWPYDEAPPFVGTRHGQWSAISLYCLCRYFHRGYPAPLWEHGVAAARQHFASLSEHAWVGGENDNLFWYCTGIAPILSYLLLTGERDPLENGNLTGLLRGLDILISGREPDWALNSASLGFLHKAAYLTGDGRFFTYARRTGVDRQTLRLGQSFWPGPELAERSPDELVGRWSVHSLPEPMWRKRTGGLTHEESFLFASWRSAADASGDFLLIKGLNGASRNPYHTFAVLEARLDGHTVLAGLQNQVRVRLDGTVESRVAMDTALRHCGVTGQVVATRGDTPHASGAAWERVLLHHVGRCLLVADRLTFHRAAAEAEVELWWEGDSDWCPPEVSSSLVGASGVRVILCDHLPTEVDGKRARMVWRGPVTEGQKLILLSAVSTPDEMVCKRVTPQAAVLSGASDLLLVSGEYEGTRGDLVSLGPDRITGTGVTRVGTPGDRSSSTHRTLLETDIPIDVDWDLAAGVLWVSTRQSTEVRLAGMANGDGPQQSFALGVGTHRIESLAPGKVTRSALVLLVNMALAAIAGKPEFETDGGLASASVPQQPLLYAARLDAGVADLVRVTVAREEWLAVASGAGVYLVDECGVVVRRLTTDGPVRVIHWWPEARVLVAGCVDEQIIAFDPVTGDRVWVFTSQMDAAVWRAAKTYWFKSQPGHEGIHGLASGAFLDGVGATGTQLFAGSACTLEIINGHGHLLKRLPVFWGPGTQFRLIAGPGGAPRLLLAREPTDSHALAVIDRDTLDGTPRAFADVPEGHSDIGGWACMSRGHIYYTDVDGDGQPEVMSEINGTWNRLTVWAADGTPKYNLQLGPGDAIPARNVRDLELIDIDGDGLPEIVAALSSGLVLAANGRCKPLWTRRLDSPPTVLAAFSGGDGLLVACEDGSVVALDGEGKITGVATMDGSARHALRVNGGVALGTDTGQVTVFGSGD